jgi:hypothetical protein
MLPQSSVINVIVGALVTGILLIINTSLNNCYQLKREKEQGIRQQESDQKKWYREKVYDSYSKIIQLLTEIMEIEFEIKNNYMTMTTENKSIKVNRLSLELMSEFQIIVYGYPAEEFDKFGKKIDEFNKNLATNTLEARAIIIEIRENDSRIKNINK